jgi:hypothetical protein
MSTKVSDEHSLQIHYRLTSLHLNTETAYSSKLPVPIYQMSLSQKTITLIFHFTYKNFHSCKLHVWLLYLSTPPKNCNKPNLNHNICQIRCFSAITLLLSAHWHLLQWMKTNCDNIPQKTARCIFNPKLTVFIFTRYTNHKASYKLSLIILSLYKMWELSFTINSI